MYVVSKLKRGGAKLTKSAYLHFQCPLQVLDGLATTFNLLPTLVYCMSLSYATVYVQVYVFTCNSVCYYNAAVCGVTYSVILVCIVVR